MTTVSDGAKHDLADPKGLSERARQHLWLHFSRMGAYSPENEIPVITHGEGAWVYDQHGRKYFDGISGLFTSQLGHGRIDLAQAAFDQASQLAYFPLWTYAHPKAIELAERIAELTPGDLNRVFFTTGGSEAVEAAWKLARHYFKLKGEPDRIKAISRDISYHGISMGALSITGVPAMKTMFEPLVPGAVKVPNTNFYRAPYFADDEQKFGLWAADEIERAILREGPETVACVFLEPVQNAGGCFTPPPGYWQRVREICDRYGVLLVSDEVICAWGRLGTYFGGQKFDYLPDMITCAKGLTSGYSPLGALITRDFLLEPYLEGATSFPHGLTFAGHPVSCAVGVANLDAFANEGIVEHVANTQGYFRAALESLSDIPIVGDIRGTGFFYGIELVKDKDSRETFTDEESERLLRGYLSKAMFERGLICRSDDRGDPVVQFAPPLISTTQEIDFLVEVMREVLTEGHRKI
ncbi:MAG: aspartate aminotransferase family protein [Actinomycetes bacterium]